MDSESEHGHGVCACGAVWRHDVSMSIIYLIWANGISLGLKGMRDRTVVTPRSMPVFA